MATLANRVKVETATTGTGTITLGSAIAGYQTFADAGISNGSTVVYTIEDGTDWEIGTGTYTSGTNTLTRSVTESSNSDNALSLTGNAKVFISPRAQDIVQPNDNVSTLTNDSGYLTTVAFGDLTSTPTTLSGYGITDAATSAQGSLADSAVQPGDNISTLTNNSGYITSADGGNAATLDGIDSTSFLRSDANDTASGVLTLTGDLKASSGVLTGTTGTARTTTAHLEMFGGTSSAVFGVQDGNGRIQLKWNATSGTGETYLVSNEEAHFWDWNLTGSEAVWEMKYGAPGTAGNTISWETLLTLYNSGQLGATAITETTYSLTGTALDPANGGIQYKTLGANTTFTESLSDGESMILRLDGGATYTVTWPTITWIGPGGNVAPTLNGTKDTFVFWQESSTFYGAYIGYGA